LGDPIRRGASLALADESGAMQQLILDQPVKGARHRVELILWHQPHPKHNLLAIAHRLRSGILRLSAPQKLKSAIL
jgi:hypothetical protein